MRVPLEIQPLPKLSFDMTCLRHPQRGYTTLLFIYGEFSDFCFFPALYSYPPPIGVFR